MSAQYVWTTPSRQLSIELSPEVVARLGLEALEAFKSVPKRGLEIGGLLLGQVEIRNGASTIYIQDFETVESEHRWGPSYNLSDADVGHLREALARHPDAVGIYRTQTRSKELSIDPDDLRLWECVGGSGVRLFVLIRPLPARAAFFLPEGDTLVAAHEFPLHANAGETFAAASAEASETKAPANRPPSPAEAAGRPVFPLPSASKVADALRKGRVADASAILVLGLVLGAAVVYRYPPAVLRKARDAPAPLALRVERDGGALELFWNRSAGAIRNAQRATIYIDDGGHQSKLDLDRNLLISGLLSYWPQTADVTFRLQVFAPQGEAHTDDSIRSVGALVAIPPAAAPAPAPPAPLSVPPASASQPVASATPAPKPATARIHTRNRTRVPANLTVAESRPSPFVPLPPPPSFLSSHAPEPDLGTLLTPVPAAKGQPEIAMSARPVEGNRLGRAFRKIPLLGRLKKPQPERTPPLPVREVRPVLTERDRRDLTQAVSIEVKVYVAETGKVRYAELLSNGNGRNRYLAMAAVDAALQWVFEPGREAGEAIPGETVLQFRFAPAEEAALKP